LSGGGGSSSSKLGTVHVLRRTQTENSENLTSGVVVSAGQVERAGTKSEYDYYYYYYYY
jgi:hypothetical protein